MEKGVTILHRIASGVVGVAIMAVGLLLLMLGVTFLPVIGILVGLPVLALSLSFFSPKVRIPEYAVVEATLGEEAEEADKSETVCSWPPAYAHRDSSLHHGTAA